MSKPNLQLKLTEALALFGFQLIEVTDAEKERLFLGNRKGSVYQVRLANGHVLCTYATLQQIRTFVFRRIAGGEGYGFHGS
jgi:hypothetical protein